MCTSSAFRPPLCSNGGSGMWMVCAISLESYVPRSWLNEIIWETNPCTSSAFRPRFWSNGGSGMLMVYAISLESYGPRSWLNDKTCKTTCVHQVFFAPILGLIRGARTLLFSIELRGSELTPWKNLKNNVCASSAAIEDRASPFRPHFWSNKGGLELYCFP